MPSPQPQPDRSFLTALARWLTELRSAAARTGTALRTWTEEHQEGIVLFFIVAQVMGDVIPRVGDLADKWRDGPWQHLLSQVELSDGLALLISLANEEAAVEAHLEAVLTDPRFVAELISAVEDAPLNPALVHQLKHGLGLLQAHDYVLAVPALIQALEGGFWHVAEEQRLIARAGDKMLRVETDGSFGKAVGGVETVLNLLSEVDPAFRTFMVRLVFGGRGHRFRHGTAVEGWRLEALLLLVALVSWLDRFGAPTEESYLRQAFAGRSESEVVAATAFPALGALAEMKPEAIRPTMEVLMSMARVGKIVVDRSNLRADVAAPGSAIPQGTASAS